MIPWFSFILLTVLEYYLEMIADEMSNEIERRNRNNDGNLAGSFNKRVKIEATNE